MKRLFTHRGAIPTLLFLNALLALALWLGGSRGKWPLFQTKTLVRLDLTAPVAWENEAAFFGAGAGVHRWIRTLDEAAKDNRVAGVLIRINSPGGTIGASQELHSAVLRFKATGKKVVVSVADLCASGAYYAAAPADLIVANPGSLVGSIGVILSAPEWSALMEKLGVRMNTVKSAPSKDILSPWRPMVASEREGLQSVIDVMYGQFLNAVLEGRTNHYTNAAVGATIRSAADGRVFAGTQAIALGLVDKLGDERQAGRELARLCGLDENTAISKTSRRGLAGLAALGALGSFWDQVTGSGAPLEFRQSIW